MRVTNGTFKYTRRIKPGDPNEYNAPFREATAEMTFIYEEGEADSAFADQVRSMVVEHVHAMLRDKPKETGVAAAEPAASHVDAVKKQPKETVQKKAVEPEIPVPAAEDPAAIDVTTPEPVKISTEDFLAAITRKNAERMARPEDAGAARRDPKVIRELVGKYVTLPKTARDVPMELRQKFLDELKEL